MTPSPWAAQRMAVPVWDARATVAGASSLSRSTSCITQSSVLSRSKRTQGSAPRSRSSTRSSASSRCPAPSTTTNSSSPRAEAHLRGDQQLAHQLVGAGPRRRPGPPRRAALTATSASRGTRGRPRWAPARSACG
ncbi:hypothetical protein [Nonomuraea sp. B1E8]|uniref:hypothetical protein n=1 Tax=unclassified Nonomuraea TaxID=2593643 RepID=UPI00325C8B70